MTMSYPILGQYVGHSDRMAACLRRIRRSSRYIAQEIGVSTSTVKNWRAGTSTMSFEAMVAVCAKFDEAWTELAAMTGRQSLSAEQILDELLQKLKETP